VCEHKVFVVESYFLSTIHLDDNVLLIPTPTFSPIRNSYS
jgi:hypothetical protein